MAIDIEDFELANKLETLLDSYAMESRHESYHGRPKYQSADEIRTEIDALIREAIAARDDELTPYRARAVIEAHNAKQKAKVEFVLDLLFPHDNYNKTHGTPRELRHPEKYWWWNGWSLKEESDPNDVTGDIRVEVESYVAGGEYETYEFDILGHWIEPDDEDAIKARVHEWCREANRRSIAAANEKTRQENLRKIQEAEATIARLKGQ